VFTYTNLIPERSDLEKDERSNYQEALHAFAWYLAQGEDATTADLIATLAKGTSGWVKLKASLGKLMLYLGTSLSKDLKDLRRKMVRETTQVALHQIGRRQE
jgi:hypothetical protein